MSQVKPQYWVEHLASIAAEQITTKAYAEREGLSVASLYYWRKRLKDDAATQSPVAHASKRQLVAVQVTSSNSSLTACTLTLAGVHLDLPQLPDPQWLATLAAASAGRVR